MRMRATAIMRTVSSTSTSGACSNGVPGTRDNTLIGTESGWGSRIASWWRNETRSSTDSPIPMMPPQHTVMSVSRTAAIVSSRSWYVRVVMTWS